MEPFLDRKFPTNTTTTPLLNNKRVVHIQRSFVQKHDEHSLDIKLIFQGQEKRNFCSLTAYMFFPRSFHIKEDGKAAWMKSIQSRVRFSLPRDEEDLAQSLYQNIVELEFLINYVGEVGLSPEIESEGLRLIKALGCVVGERLKSFLREIQDDIEHVSSNEERDEFLRNLQKNIRIKEELLRKLVKLYELDQKKCFPFLFSLRDFIFYRWIETRHEVLAILEMMSFPENVKMNLFSELSGFDGLEKKDNESHYLYLSNLKKFFQSDMFLESKQHDNIKKWSEPLAALAAGLAAFSVGYFESFTHHTWQLSGVVIVGLGAVMYAFKDRAKDKLRTVMNNLIGTRIADFKHYLKAKGQAVGVFHQWLRILTVKSLPENIRAIRKEHMQSIIEPHIEEDVLQFRKEIRVFSEDMNTRHLALYDTIRVNFSLFLKYLDDPEKSIVEMSNEGELNKVSAHRIYCATLVIQEAVGARPKSFWQNRILRRIQIQGERYTSFRLVFDKRGLHRITQLK